MGAVGWKQVCWEGLIYTTSTNRYTGQIIVIIYTDYIYRYTGQIIKYIHRCTGHIIVIYADYSIICTDYIHKYTGPIFIIILHNNIGKSLFAATPKMVKVLEMDIRH